MAKRIEMTFKDVENKSMKITVDNVKDNVADDEVKLAMNTIIEKNVFSTEAGSLTAIADAKLVEVTETDLDVE